VSQISIERKCDRVRRRIADALEHRELFLLPERQQRRERGMQARPRRERKHAVVRERELRTQRVVSRIGIGNEGVEAVVAALELDQHQQVAVVCRRRRAANATEAEPTPSVFSAAAATDDCRNVRRSMVT
jgi:hypothetical protein